ncbi:hypothetical protein [Ponticaulis koreensis]|uniref:hypothetical protein n=1 Tax=Ponticaulis koreensis TaxID=1123045 RepID=UPI0003B3AA5E|nr:hypothetical protein [Ponticaulis koreensis]
MQTSPETETNRFTPLAIARRLAGYIARLSGFVEDYREAPPEAFRASLIPAQAGIPNDQGEPDPCLRRDERDSGHTTSNAQAQAGRAGETSQPIYPHKQSEGADSPSQWRGNAVEQTSKPHMQLRYKQRFLTHIRRVEYTLRCYILWLAAQLIERGFMPSAPPERQSHPAPEQDLTGLIRKQELELRRLTSETPRIGGFSVTTPDFSNSRKASERRGLSFRPDPLSVVPIADLMARMARLPRVLKRADLLAERLVWKALNCHPEAPRTMTSDRAGAASPIQRIGLAGEQKSKRQPLFYKPFENWLPPEELWASSEDEEERGDLNYLHHLAREGLNTTGYGIPPPGANDALPRLTHFQPPAIRPL